MGRKAANLILFFIVVLASAGLTFFVGRDAYMMMIYNFVFLFMMVILYLIGTFGGMFRLLNLSRALERATDKLGELFLKHGKADSEKLRKLNGIFDEDYLDTKMNNFVQAVANSPEGIAEIEEYINEDEIDVHVHKRLLEMVPDILTSLGILGTFIGLVWGLKNFEPSNYEAMTNSVSSLVEGIKVAFLTSIYGISLSIVYSYGMKSAYSVVNEKLQSFLERFHASVIPTAENESRNLLVSSTRQQIEVMGDMSGRMAKEMAENFEKSIAPIFEKMNASLDGLAGSMNNYHEEAIKNIVQAFLREMNKSFRAQLGGFNNALQEMQKAQADNTEFTGNLYKEFSKELSDSYQKQERLMKNAVRDLLSSMENVNRISGEMQSETLEIQKQQRVDYEHILAYMKEAEKTSAEYWIACNQAMKKYVEIAAESTEKLGTAGKVSAAVIRENRGLLQTLNERIGQYAEAEKQSAEVMKEVNRLLSEMSAERSGNEIYLRSSSGREYERLQKTIEAQGERQEELLTELISSVKELTKSNKKSKGLFR